MARELSLSMVIVWKGAEESRLYIPQCCLRYGAPFTTTMSPRGFLVHKPSSRPPTLLANTRGSREKEAASLPR